MSDALSRLNAALAGRYRIEREAGAGGMATVYLAEDLRHGRRVALKVLRPELAATLGSERFFREIQVAARLQHPHILPLHDSGEADGFLYYVMPFVEGESLRERLARGGELPVHDAVRILVEVTDALAYAHQQGVVHRDMKPDNVMLSGRHALVTDFGVAKAVSEATGRQPLTTAGVALGTPAYMAPEQAAADPTLDHRVDIYALGAMAYELLTGRPPFIGMTSQQILAAHVTQAPDPVSRHRPSCPPALEAVVMRCLAKRAADRWQTADELLQQLEPLATPSGGMTPTQTRPITAVAMPAAPRRWLPVLAAAAVVVAAGGWFLTRGRERPEVPLERRQLTSTGNAGNPAISADGKRVAYLVRRCDSGDTCTVDVVAQDVDGGGMSTVARGFLGAWGLQWSADGRHLLVLASRGPTAWGPFSVPVLGGEPRHLGCCFGSIVGTGDTVLVSGITPPGDSVGWVRRMSLVDGAVLDSFPVNVPFAVEFGARLLGDGRRVLIAVERGQSLMLIVTDPRGVVLDSLLYASPNGRRIDPVPDDDGFILWASRASGEVDLLHFRVSRSGRISAQPDTVLRQLPAGAFGAIGRSGALVYSHGPTEYTVRALTRTGTGTGLHYTLRPLVRSTTTLGASLFGDGARILLFRNTGTSDVRTQFSLMPFDSGPEVPLGPPVPMVDFDPAPDGRSMIVATRLGSDSLLVSRMEVPSARTTRLLHLPRSTFLRLEATTGGGIMVQTGFTTLRTIGVPGIPDTTWEFPDFRGTIEGFDPSPDGKALVALGWDLQGDSVVANRMSLLDGSTVRLAAFAGEDFGQPRWFADGTVLLQIGEAAWSQTWFLMPAGGGPVTRLGPTPHSPAAYRFSLDGSRAVERQSDARPDVFLIPNFGEVLKR